MTEIKIEKEAISEDIDMLEDLVLSAVNNALQKAEEKAAESMGQVGLGGGMDLSQFFK